jgi:hypothetical protein
VQGTFHSGRLSGTAEIRHFETFPGTDALRRAHEA